MCSKRTSQKPDVKTRRSSGLRTSADDQQPKLLIVAGPNGAGKTTLFQNTIAQDLGRAVWVINPDLLAARIRVVESLDLQKANLEAVKRIEKWLTISIEAHQTIGVETVLSTRKYRKLVRLAKAKEFQILLVYVLLRSPALHVRRVRARVQKGGHAVPKAKILARRQRSLKQLPWFLQHADMAWLYDNSSARPRLMGFKAQSRIVLDDSTVLPEIRAAIATLARKPASSR